MPDLLLRYAHHRLPPRSKQSLITLAVPLSIERAAVVGGAVDLDHQAGVAIHEVNPTDPLVATQVDLTVQGRLTCLGQDPDEPPLEAAGRSDIADRPLLKDGPHEGNAVSAMLAQLVQ
jgi:hypothetical protein